MLISNLQQPNIEGVQIKVLSEPVEAKTIRAFLSHPKEFRFNFWHSSIARFAYLHSYQKEIEKPILHIESDVILSKDFPIEAFEDTSKLAFPILSKYRGVASIFHSPNSESLRNFTEFIVTEAKKYPEITDMTALRLYFDSDSTLVELLPAGPVDKESYSRDIEEDIYMILRAQVEKFGGIFDGSDIGMYLFGTDPRNALGKTYLRKEIDTTYTIMSKMKFSYNTNRDFLDVESEGKLIPIFNLHMTCKDLRLFGDKSMRNILQKYLSHNSYEEVFIKKIYCRMGFAKILRTIKSIYR